MAKVSFDYSKAAKFISDSEITNMERDRKSVV